MRDLVLDQLRHLAGNLSVLQGRVRQAVAGEVARAVAETVGEVIDTIMSGRFIRLAGDRSAYATSQSRSYAGADWDDDDNQYWQEMPEKEPDQPEGALKTNVPAALAMALTAGRWWLLRGRSPLSAAGLGLAVGGALLAGGPIAHTLLGIVWAAHRLMAVSDALGDSACSVDRD